MRQLRDAAGVVIGSVFFGTLLKSMRQSSLKGPYGHGGRGEEIFAGQLHELLAERLGGALSGGPADVLFQRLQDQQRLVAQSQASSGTGRRQE